MPCDAGRLVWRGLTPLRGNYPRKNGDVNHALSHQTWRLVERIP